MRWMAASVSGEIWLRWHQEWNSSFVSIALILFPLAGVVEGSGNLVQEHRRRSPATSIPEIEERDKFPTHIFSFLSGIISLFCL